MVSRAKSWVVCLAAAVSVAVLAACANQPPPPEIVSESQGQVSILADLHASPRPLAKAYCAQTGKRPILRDTAPAGDNLIRGWATGTKVFVFTFDCL